MKVDKLHRGLTDAGYLCTRQFAAQVSASINNKPVAGAFLYGPAGTGKSYLPMIISQITGHKMFFFQCAPGTKEDDLLMKLWPDETTASGVKVSPGAVYEAAEASHKKKGRISIPAKQTTAKFENMMVFFTANDERQFHEAFYRRFPKIDMTPLSPKLVRQALQLTHAENPYIDTMVMLYKRTLAAQLPKAATIQELRQLMDAIDHLGEDADWNTLVYQFVTKTEENHQLLAKGEDDSDEMIQREMVALNPEVYHGEISNIEQHTHTASMPDPTMARLEDIHPDDSGDTIETGESTLLLGNTKAAYTFLYNLSNRLPIHSGKMQWAKVCGGHLISDQTIYLEKIYHLHQTYDATFQGQAGGKRSDSSSIRGEVMLSEPLATLDDISWIIKHGTRIQVHRASADEVIFRGFVSSETFNTKIDFKWSRGNGLDIICPVSSLEALMGYLGHLESNGKPKNGPLPYVRSIGYNEYYNASRASSGVIGDFHLKALARKDTYMDCTFDDTWGVDEHQHAIADKDIPHHATFTGLDKMVIVPTKQHKTYTYGNVEWKFYHYGYKRNTKLRIRIHGKIESPVEPFLMAYSFRGNIPLTKACVHSMPYSDIKDKLTDDGWTILPDARAFKKGMLNAKVLDNVMVFSTIVRRSSWPDNFTQHVNTCIDILDILCEDYGD